MRKARADEDSFSSHFDICRSELRGVAIVNIYMTSKYVTRIKTSLRVTLVGQLASLGGVMGLFTGMSLLSVFELFMWFARALKERILPATRKRQKKVAQEEQQKP